MTVTLLRVTSHSHVQGRSDQERLDIAAVASSGAEGAYSSHISNNTNPMPTRSQWRMRNVYGAYR